MIYSTPRCYGSSRTIISQDSNQDCSRLSSVTVKVEQVVFLNESLIDIQRMITVTLHIEVMTVTNSKQKYSWCKRSIFLRNTNKFCCDTFEKYSVNDKIIAIVFATARFSFEQCEPHNCDESLNALLSFVNYGIAMLFLRCSYNQGKLQNSTCRHICWWNGHHEHDPKKPLDCS